MKPGRIRKKLADTLNERLRFVEGEYLIWRPEKLYQARGRQPKFSDRYKWSGAAEYAASGRFAGLYDCWESMTECAAAKKFSVSGNLIEIVK